MGRMDTGLETSGMAKSSFRATMYSFTNVGILWLLAERDEHRGKPVEWIARSLNGANTMKADRRFHGMRCVDNEDKTCLRSGAARVLPAANLLRGATVLAAVLLCVCAAQAAIVQTDTTYANVTDLNAQLSGTDLANVGQATFASHTVSTNACSQRNPG